MTRFIPKTFQSAFLTTDYLIFHMCSAAINLSLEEGFFLIVVTLKRSNNDVCLLIYECTFKIEFSSFASKPLNDFVSKLV